MLLWITIGMTFVVSDERVAAATFRGMVRPYAILVTAVVGLVSGIWRLWKVTHAK